MKTQITTLLICACISSCSSQTVTRSRYAPIGNEISATSAIEKCRQFVSLINVASQDWSKSQLQLTRSYNNKNERMWMVTSADYGINVDAKSGEIMSFSNHRKTANHQKSIGRTGNAVSRDAARRTLNDLASRLQITPSASLLRFDYETDATARSLERHAGTFGATYAQDSKIVATISCDIQDGIPVHITLK